MRFLDRVDISGSVVMASTAKDQFTIGTPLENNDGNVDNLTVHANADFKNNVIIGSSAADTLNINATISGNVGNITASNIYLQNGTIYLNGQDVLSNMGGGGGNEQGGGNQQGGGGSNSTKYYTYSLVTSSTHYINANDTYDIYYTDPTSVSGNIYIYLPDASNNNVVNRMYHFKQIKDANYFTVINTVNNQTVDGAPSYSFTSVGGPSSTRSSLTVHAMMDTRDNSFKWFVFFYP